MENLYTPNGDYMITHIQTESVVLYFCTYSSSDEVAANCSGECVSSISDRLFSGPVHLGKVKPTFLTIVK